MNSFRDWAEIIASRQGHFWNFQRVSSSRILMDSWFSTWGCAPCYDLRLRCNSCLPSIPTRSSTLDSPRFAKSSINRNAGVGDFDADLARSLQMTTELRQHGWRKRNLPGEQGAPSGLSRLWPTLIKTQTKSFSNHEPSPSSQPLTATWANFPCKKINCEH